MTGRIKANISISSITGYEPVQQKLLLIDLLPPTLQQWANELEKQGLDANNPEEVLEFVYLFNETNNIQATVHAFRSQRAGLSRMSINPDFGTYITDQRSTERIKEVREQFEFDMNYFEKKDQGVEGVWQCSNCKKWKTQITVKQVRAGDEGMTTFIKCLTCGKVVVRQ